MIISATRQMRRHKFDSDIRVEMQTPSREGLTCPNLLTGYNDKSLVSSAPSGKPTSSTRRSSAAPISTQVPQVSCGRRRMQIRIEELYRMKRSSRGKPSPAFQLGRASHHSSPKVLNHLPLSHGQRPSHPSFSLSFLSPWTMRSPRLTCILDGYPPERSIIVSKTWLVVVVVSHGTPPFYTERFIDKTRVARQRSGQPVDR